MTTEKKILFTNEDLAIVSVKCNQCGTELAIDTSKEPHPRIREQGKALNCPVCGMQFDSKLKDALAQVALALTAARSSGQILTFRVNLPDDD